jgi:ADP-ribose pyrophosphatase YjhB (NUDIX family)
VTAINIPGFIADREWEWAQRNLPITCVDILPIQLEPGGTEVQRIGLIIRDDEPGMPFFSDGLWVPVGGRIRYSETMQDAVNRHLTDALDSPPDYIEPTPFFVNQFFPELLPGMGVDTRKHAVALCFAAVFSADHTPQPRGEAVDFQWFTPDALPPLWPGTDVMVQELLNGRSSIVYLPPAPPWHWLHANDKESGDLSAQ